MKFNWELLWQLSMRDVRARYKQSYLGAVWVLFQPLAQLAIFTTVFAAHFATSDSKVPYSLFVMSGLIPWTAMVGAINAGSISLLNNSALLKKIYFPRDLLPLSTICSSLVDFALGMGLLLVYQVVIVGLLPGLHILWLPIVLTLHVALLAGLTFLLAPTVVFVRDLRHVIPTALMLMMFLTPIIYPLEKAPRLVQMLSPYNPAATLLACYRHALLGTPFPSLLQVGVMAGLIVTFLGFGWAFLKRSESLLAELV